MLHEPTMGLYLLREYLSENGFKVDVLDGTYQSFDDEEILKKAQNSRAIGFYAVYTNMPKIFKLASLIKQKKADTIIVIGGPNWPAGKEILIAEPAIDMVIKEDAEVSIESILSQLRDKGGLTPEIINGIFFRSGNDIIAPGNTACSVTPTRVISIQFEVPVAKKRVLKLITAKGCPNNCLFCPAPDWKELSKVEDTVKEIETAWCQGIDTFYIADENFCPPGLSDRVTLFCDLLKNSNIITRPINLKLFLEPHTPIPIIKYLSQVAYINAFVGFESFSDKSLAFFGKKNSRRQNLLFWDSAKKIGINILPGIIALHPFSTPEELLDLIHILTKYDALAWRLLIKKIDLYPGTGLLTKMKTEFPNLLKVDFLPFLRPSHWNYAYDQDLRNPVMASIEKAFTNLADDKTIKDVYSLMSDLSFMVMGKNDEMNERYNSIRSNFIIHTRELAIKIIRINKQYPYNNAEKKLEPSIAKYIETVNVIHEDFKNLFMALKEK